MRDVDAGGTGGAAHAQAVQDLWDACAQNDVFQVARLLAQSTFDVAMEVGFTRLQWACARGDSEELAILLASEQVDEDDRTAQQHDVAHTAMLPGLSEPPSQRQLQARSPDGHASGDDAPAVQPTAPSHVAMPPRMPDPPPLHVACQHGPDGIMVEALLAGAGSLLDVNATDHLGHTALLVASVLGYSKVVSTLLQNGAMADLADRDGHTPLFAASCNGHIGAVTALIQHSSSSLNLANKDGRTPLFAACCNGHLEVVKALLQEGASTQADKAGWTPLHAASCHSQLEATISEMHQPPLRHLSSLPDAPNATSKLGSDSKRREVLAFLVSPEYYTLDTQAAKHLKARDQMGRTPLLLASRRGSTDAVDVLIGAGAELNITDMDGRSALWLAVFYGHVGCAHRLLEAGAAVDLVGPLQVIIAHVESAAEVPIQGVANDRRTALMSACADGNAALAKALLDAKARVDLKDKFQRTALHIACAANSLPVVQALLGAIFKRPEVERALLINARDLRGWAPLHEACAHNSCDVLQTLQEAISQVRADAKPATKDGNTPLHLACEAGHYKVVQQLLACGADVAAKNKRGATPQDLAARCGSTKVLKLLQKGAAPETQEAKGAGTRPRTARGSDKVPSRLHPYELLAGEALDQLTAACKQVQDLPQHPEKVKLEGALCACVELADALHSMWKSAADCAAVLSPPAEGPTAVPALWPNLESWGRFKAQLNVALRMGASAVRFAERIVPDVVRLAAAYRADRKVEEAARMAEAAITSHRSSSTELLALSQALLNDSDKVATALAYSKLMAAIKAAASTPPRGDPLAELSALHNQVAQGPLDALLSDIGTKAANFYELLLRSGETTCDGKPLDVNIITKLLAAVRQELGPSRLWRATSRVALHALRACLSTASAVKNLDVQKRLCASSVLIRHLWAGQVREAISADAKQLAHSLRGLGEVLTCLTTPGSQNEYQRAQSWLQETAAVCDFLDALPLERLGPAEVRWERVQQRMAERARVSDGAAPAEFVMDVLRSEGLVQGKGPLADELQVDATTLYLEMAAMKGRADAWVAAQIAAASGLQPLRGKDAKEHEPDIVASRQRSSGGPAPVPEPAMCPLNQRVMHDPVQLAGRGVARSYERVAIERHLALLNTDPYSGKPLQSTELVPNTHLRTAIQWWLFSQGLHSEVPIDLVPRYTPRGYLYRIDPVGGPGGGQFDHAQWAVEQGTHLGCGGLVLAELCIHAWKPLSRTAAVYRRCTEVAAFERFEPPHAGNIACDDTGRRFAVNRLPADDSSPPAQLVAMRAHTGKRMAGAGTECVNALALTSMQASGLLETVYINERCTVVHDSEHHQELGLLSIGIALAGIYGRAGDSLDRFGVYICPAVPASWSLEGHGRCPPPFKDQVRALVCSLHRPGMSEEAQSNHQQAVQHIVRHLFNATFLAKDAGGHCHNDYIAAWLCHEAQRVSWKQAEPQEGLQTAALQEVEKKRQYAPHPVGHSPWRVAEFEDIDARMSASAVGIAGAEGHLNIEGQDDGSSHKGGSTHKGSSSHKGDSDHKGGSTQRGRGRPVDPSHQEVEEDDDEEDDNELAMYAAMLSNMSGIGAYARRPAPGPGPETLASKPGPRSDEHEAVRDLPKSSGS